MMASLVLYQFFSCLLQHLYFMVSEPSSATGVDTSAEDNGRSTLIHAVIGAVAGTVFSFIPLSPLLGGAVAGYLEGGETENGLKVGGIAGVMMLIPFVFLGMAVVVVLGFGMMGRSAIGIGVMALFALLFGALYTVGLSIAGGYLGIYLKNEL